MISMSVFKAYDIRGSLQKVRKKEGIFFRKSFLLKDYLQQV